jgi:hypothetical protein
MVQPGGGFDLAEKPLRAECDRKLGSENFDGDEATVLQVLGEVDNRHPAAAEFALDRVSVAEGCME